MIIGIVAIDKNHGIGNNGSMPWPHLKDDLKWFKSNTLNQVVIMGRKTWNSIGNTPLPNRINIVISKSFINNCDFSCNSPLTALEKAKLSWPEKDIFIIGGSSIYQEFFNVIDKFYITEINHTYTCDTFFDFNLVKENFKKIKTHVIINEPVQYNINEYLK